MHATAADCTDRSCIYALSVAPEAFAARVVLARAAERSIDAQYYIWHGDTTGHLLLEELWNAAERGVRVRLLLDDNGIAGLDPTLAAFDSHRNIEVRLFNPFPNRRFKALGYLMDFWRLNRRMHNKSFTADSEATIVGGRNVGDEYFGADQLTEFADLDVLAVGPAAREVTAAFDQYWNHEAAQRAQTVIGKAPPRSAAAMLKHFSAVHARPEAVLYLEAVSTTPLIEALLAGQLKLGRAHTQLLYDPPVKVKGRTPDARLVFANLQSALGEPQQAIDLVSPYFVPGSKGTKALAEFAARGVMLRILTNSLSATDVAVVHAGYAKRRKPLLRAGARIYELKSELRSLNRVRGRRRVGRSAASLHAKTFSVDRKRVFVGSLNLDPRSVHLNTEMGLVIESPALAAAAATEFDQAAQDDAYEVVLESGRLGWVESRSSGKLRLHTEPNTSFLKRLLVRVFAWLPIEWLL